MSAFPLLERALDESRLRQYSSVRDQILATTAKGDALSATLAQNPFSKLPQEAVAGWVETVALYQQLSQRSKLNASQKGDLAIKLGEASRKNGDLKILDSFYAKLLDSLTGDFLAQLEGVLTQAYVFVYEREKKVKLIMEEFRGQKIVKIRLVVPVDGVDYEEETDDEGFSAQVTLGTMLLAHFLIAADYPRIIFFDETLGSHADAPLAKFMILIEQLKRDFGFKFLAVTHDKHRLAPYADRAYHVQDGVYALLPQDRV